MDLPKMDILHLYLLWQASDGNPLFKKQIEDELQQRIRINEKFSIEDLYYISAFRSKSLTISFIPTSSSHTSYGSCVTVKLIFSKEELEVRLKNYFAKPTIRNFGQLRAENLLKGKFSEYQNRLLETEGFSTLDILELKYI